MSDEFHDRLEESIPRLRRYARVLTRDAERADDLVQDTLIRAIDRERLFTPGTNLMAWLFTILHNIYVSNMRHENRAPFAPSVEDGHPKLASGGNQMDTMELRDLEAGLNALGENQRQVLLLIGLEGMSYEDAAEILNIPVGTVRSRLHRARDTLREMTERGGEPPKSAEEDDTFQEIGDGSEA